MSVRRVADGDRVDHDPGLAQVLDGGGPGSGVIFTVGEEDDRPPLGPILVSERVDGHVKTRAQVGAARLNIPRSKLPERLRGRPEVLGQGTAEPAAPGEGHHRGAVARVFPERPDQAFGRLNRHAKPVGNGILGPHAPARVHQEDDVVPRGERRNRPTPPPRLGERQDEAEDRREPAQRTVTPEPAALTQQRPVPSPPEQSTHNPGEEQRKRDEEPE